VHDGVPDAEARDFDEPETAEDEEWGEALHHAVSLGDTLWVLLELTDLVHEVDGGAEDADVCNGRLQQVPDRVSMPGQTPLVEEIDPQGEKRRQDGEQDARDEDDQRQHGLGVCERTLGVLLQAKSLATEQRRRG
jgi:hypothetical protein